MLARLRALPKRSQMLRVCSMTGRCACFSASCIAFRFCRVSWRSFSALGSMWPQTLRQLVSSSQVAQHFLPLEQWQ